MKKTFSFAIVHFCVAFSVAYALTGSLVIGGAVALVEPAVNTLAYHLHEKAWNGVQEGHWQRWVESVQARISGTIWGRAA